MINKKFIMAVLVLMVSMPVKAEPAGNPVQDPKAGAPMLQGVSHEGKSKVVKKEHKKVEKTAKATGSIKAPESKTVPSTDESKKTN